MPLFAWGLDEIVEAIGLFYVIIVVLLITLVAMERNLTEPKPQLPLVRRLSRQWLDGDPNVDPRPIQLWLSRSHVRDAAKLSRKLRLSHEETISLLNLAGYQLNQSRQSRRRNIELGRG